MVEYNYVVYTSLSRNFDPEIEGSTLGSIVSSCGGIVDWSIPGGLEKTKIYVVLDRPLDKDYLTGQLESEFENCGNKDEIVLKIR